MSVWLSKYRTFWICLAVFLFLIIWQYWPLLTGQTLVYGDNYSLLVPGKLFTAYWIKQHVLPLWNPYLFSGLPWLADVNQSVLYPSTLLFIVLQPWMALNFTILLHLAITFGGMYLLARLWTKSNYGALIAAILWTGSAQITASINNLSTIQSLAWMPLLVYFGLKLNEAKRNSVLFALVLFLQLAGGYPQYVMYSVVIAVVLSAIYVRGQVSWKRWSVVWLSTLLLSMGLTAVIWLPLLEFVSTSTRSTQSSQQAAMGLLEPPMLLKTILPYLFDKLSAGYRWAAAWVTEPTPALYITWFGLLVIGLSLVKRRRTSKDLWLLAIAVIGTLWALGSNLPGYTWFHQMIPLLGSTRSTSLALAGVNVVLCLMVAEGVKKLWSEPVRIPKQISILAFLGLLLMVSIYFGASHRFDQVWWKLDSLGNGLLSSSQFHSLEKDAVLFEHIGMNLLVNAVLFWLAVMALVRHKKAWLVLLLSLDMLYNTRGLLVFAPANVYPSWSEIHAWQETKKLDSDMSRALTRNSNESYTDFVGYWGALAIRAPFSDSYIDSQELTTFTHLRRLQDTLTPNWSMVASVPVMNGFATLLPSDYASLWQQGDELGINFIDQVDLSNPLLSQWSVDTYLVDTGFGETPETIALSKLKDNQGLVTYTLPALPRLRLENSQQAPITDYVEDPNNISFIVNSNSEQALILANRFDPNWRAWVNEVATPVHNQGGMQQINLIQGQNKVRLQYQLASVKKGFLISLLTLCATVLWLIHERRQKLLGLKVAEPRRR